jgi:hypothetical protein
MGGKGSRALRLAGALMVMALFGSACGSSESETSQRSAAGPADETIAVDEVFTLSVGDSLGAVRLASCADLAARSLCQWVVNSMYSFTGENTLTQNGDVALSKAYDVIEHGVVTSAWPPPQQIPNLPDASVHWRYESQGMFTGVETTVYYSAPSGYPVGEQVGFYGKVPYSASNAFECRQGEYLSCRVVRNEGSKDALVLYEVSNSPVVVRITNRLGTEVIREGQPQLSSFLVAPTGGDPAVVAAGATGWAGGFRSRSQDSRYQVSYVVGDADTSLAGARATVNAVIDHTTGLDKGSTCTVSNPRTTGVQLACKVTVTGGTSGPGAIEVTLSR